MLVVVTGDAPELEGRGRRTRTFRYLGTFAAEQGLTVFFTTPDRFRLPDSRARAGVVPESAGWLYQPQRGRFLPARASLDPTRVAVYDAMYLRDLTRHRAAYQRLYRGWVRCGYRFFNPVLPTKDVIYQHLRRCDIRPAHLPQTWLEVTPHGVLDLLATRRRLWLKPTLGSGGRNIAVIERLNGGYRVVAERFFDASVDEEMSKSRFRRWLQDAFARRTYMAQEEVPLLCTNDGRRIDFRVTVARFGQHEWRTIAITARVGARGSHLTNFHAGGRAHSLTEPAAVEEMLGVEFRHNLAPVIEKSAVSVAKAISGRYRNLCILGVDVGATEDGNIYVYDFNGRPGRDILKEVEVEQAMAAVAAYGRTLLRGRRRSGGESQDRPGRM